jgi:hypothetical protein
MEKEKIETCANCSGEINSNTCIDGEKATVPRPDDLSICMYCGQPYYFDENLKKVAISKEKYRAMPTAAKDILKEAWKVRAEIIKIALQQGSKFDS